MLSIFSYSIYNYLSSIICDCDTLVDFFEFVVLSHVCRTENKIAHALTELAQIFEFSVPVFWLEDAHPSVLPLVVSDNLMQ